MVNKYIGNGTTLGVSTGSSTSAATAVGGVISVGGPGGDAPDVDTTTMDSTSNYTTQLRGFRAAGELALEVAYDPADVGWVKILAMDASGVGGTFVTTFASTALATESFKGYVKSVGRTINRDAMITRQITVGATSGPGFN